MSASAVPVSVIRGFPAHRLSEVEKSWHPAREQLADAMAGTGMVLESGHWDWRWKASSVEAGERSLVAVEYEGEVQGLMALQTALRRSVLTPGRWVVYLDYIETAPWNQRVEGVQTPRFRGVGVLLVGEAVRVSLGRTAGCRVGLHALTQAERFYDGHCRMTRIGPDPDYHDLVYFEYADGVASEWLTTAGLSP